MAYVRPKFVSEREKAETWVDGRRVDDAKWEDCGPTSVLMAVNATSGGSKPSVMTLDEAERLRMDAGYGPLGGTNIQQLAGAAVKRYRINLPRYVSGFDAIWKSLAPGYGAAISGSMAPFGPTHRLSRWLPNFDGGHAVYVQRESTTDRVFWLDPLASSSYTGEWVTKEELRLFFSRGIAAAVVVPLVRS